MAVPRSAFYAQANLMQPDDTALVERMHAIQSELPAYGYRRITAQLRAEGVRVNRKRVARLMRRHGMQVRPRRRYVATTDSDHESPIFANLAKDMVPTDPTNSGSPTSVCRSKRRERWGTAPRNRLAGAGCKPP